MGIQKSMLRFVTKIEIREYGIRYMKYQRVQLWLLFLLKRETITNLAGLNRISLHPYTLSYTELCANPLFLLFKQLKILLDKTLVIVIKFRPIGIVKHFSNSLL